MATGKYYGSERKPFQGQGSGGGIDSMAEQYVPSISKILLFEKASPDDIKIGVEMIERLVRSNKRVTTHQIRNIYSLIQDLGEEDKEKRLKELHRLRPKLAYIGARQREIDGKIIIKVLDELIKTIDLKDGEDNVIKKIKGLHYIMESIVAYHKFHSNN
ncbi:MAG: type III-A CRISPR-associated protein Csm2 [Chitinophagaceae bacterium]